MAILINANQDLKRFKREVEFTEIKHGELTSGEFSEPHSKRKKLKDEKYDEGMKEERKIGRTKGRTGRKLKKKGEMGRENRRE